MKNKLIQLVFCLVLAIQSCQSSVLYCSFSSGSCNVVNITDVTSANEQITVAGKPSGFQDSSVFSLSFQSPSKLFYVPTGVFSIFPNLQSFSMQNVSLNNMVSNAFANCGLLMSLTIMDNNFPDLPASFAPCINVTTINMMTNKIKNVDADALKGLTFLNYLNLRENQITCIPPGLFKNTPVIQNIDLYGNQITSLDRLTFKGLPNLMLIVLGANKIASIPSFDLTLTGMTMGFNIMIDNNPIMAINPQFLTSLFSSRPGSMSMTNLNFFDSYGNMTTCFPKNNMYVSSISYYNWPTANISLGDCYANWTPEIESTPVSCAPPTTTTQKVPTSTGGNNSEEDIRRWGSKKNFFAIISNAMRNFTANVQFF